MRLLAVQRGEIKTSLVHCVTFAFGIEKYFEEEKEERNPVCVSSIDVLKHTIIIKSTQATCFSTIDTP